MPLVDAEVSVMGLVANPCVGMLAEFPESFLGDVTSFFGCGHDVWSDQEHQFGLLALSNLAPEQPSQVGQVTQARDFLLGVADRGPDQPANINCQSVLAYRIICRLSIYPTC